MLSSKTGGGKFSWGNATIGKLPTNTFTLCNHFFQHLQKLHFVIYVTIHVYHLCRLGLYREAEKQFRSALNHQEMVDTYLYLAKVVHDRITSPKTNLLHNEKYFLYELINRKTCPSQVYQRLDQPITALNLFKQGLDHFPGEVTLLTGIARIHEVQYAALVLTTDELVLSADARKPIFTFYAVISSQEMNNISSATEYYRDVLKQDNTHVEAIACIGSNHFYTDQPEIALRFYRLDKMLQTS